MPRTLITLNEVQWSKVEDRSRRCPPGHAIIDFWQEALGLTVEEWDRLPRHSFKVQDYEVTQVDYERLTAILLIKAKGKMARNGVSVTLLDMGPAVAK